MKPTADSRLLIVHLSDMHLWYGKSNAILGRANALAEAIASSEAMQDRRFLIIFSGDIAFSGTGKEYAMARSFFDDLKHRLSELGVNDFSTFIIPGNHDCDFTLSNKTREILISQIYTGAELDESVIDTCTIVQKHFFEFKANLESEVTQTEHPLAWSADLEFFGKKVRVNGFNTSWVSQRREDYGQLFMPVDLFNLESPDSDLVVSTFHHPYSWVPVENRNEFSNYIESISDFSLSGHEHVSQLHEISSRGISFQKYIMGGALQENSNQDLSSFNILVISPEDSMFKVEVYNFDGKSYKIDYGSDAWSGFQGLSKRNKNKLQIKKDYIESIKEGDFKFTNGQRNLSDNELFTHPNLREISAKEQARRIDPSMAKTENAVIKGERFITRILEMERVIIYGQERAGKTTLARQTQIALMNTNIYPLFLDCSSVDRYEDSTPQKMINEALRVQYLNDSAESYMRLGDSERIVIVDNYSSSLLNDNARNHLALALKRFCKYIIFLSNDDAAVDGISIIKTIQNVKDFHKLEIIPFGHFLRFELIKKWYKPNDIYNADLKAIENRCISVERIITSMMSNKLVTPYPLQILIMLQHIETSVGSDVNSSSYASFCEVQIKSDLSRVSHRYGLDQGTLNSVLEDLSFRMHKNGVKHFSKSEYLEQIAIYAQEHLIPAAPTVLMDAAVKVGIIKVVSGNVQFSQGYQLFYFIASKINTILQVNPNKGKEEIENLCDEIYLGDNANIIIFLGHLTRSPILIDVILDHSRSLLRDSEHCDFDTSTEFAGRLISSIPEVTFKLTDPTTNRILHYQNKDKSYTDEDFEVEGELDDEQRNEIDKQELDKTLEHLIQVNTVFKTIDVIGHILKTYPGTLTAEAKIALTKECYDLTMRGLGMMYTVFRENLDDMVKFVDYILNSDRDSDKPLTANQIEERSKAFIFQLLTLMGQTFLYRLTNAIGAQKLSIVFDKLLENAPISYHLIDFSIRLGTFFRIDPKSVSKLYELTENKVLPRMIFIRLVLRFFNLYNVDRVTVQKICSQLGINYRDALVSSVKGADEKRNIGRGILNS